MSLKICFVLNWKEKIKSQQVSDDHRYKWELASAILLVRKIKYRNLEEPNTLEEPTT